MLPRAAAIAPDSLKTLLELYVGFFNRVPEADGIAYWQQWLGQPGHRPGAMVLQMLHDAHQYFTGDLQVGWVVRLVAIPMDT